MKKNRIKFEIIDKLYEEEKSRKKVGPRPWGLESDRPWQFSRI